MENKTPLQEAINQVRSLKYRGYSKEEIVTILQSLLPKEKEFVGNVFEAGADWAAEVLSLELRKPKQPDRDQFINQLYPEK